MKTLNRVLTWAAALLTLSATALAQDNCVSVNLTVFLERDGSCAVRDYTVTLGDTTIAFQEEYYPWTALDGSKFTCEVAGPTIYMPPPIDAVLPTSIQGTVSGTVGDKSVTGNVWCAGHQNPFVQYFLALDLAFLRVQQVTVFALDVPVDDGTVPIHLAATGTGVMDLRDLTNIDVSFSMTGVGLITGDQILEAADTKFTIQGYALGESGGTLTGWICDDTVAALTVAE